MKENNAGENTRKRKKLIYALIVSACSLLLIAATVLTVYFVTRGNDVVLETPVDPGDDDPKDPDDDKFFNLAKASGASWLISKDKKVLKARGKAKRFGCALIKPENFPI